MATKYTLEEVQNYIQGLRDQGLSGDSLHQAIASAAVQLGASPQNIGLALNVPQETVSQYIANYRQSTPTHSDEDVRTMLSQLENQYSGRELDQQIYQTAKNYGVTADQIDRATGQAPGTAQAWVDNNIQPSNNAGNYSDQEVKGFIDNLATQYQGDELGRQIQQAAGQYGVTPDQIDRAVGQAPGTAQNWVNAQQQAPTPTLATPTPYGPGYGLGAAVDTTQFANQMLGGVTGNAMDLIGAAGQVGRNDLRAGAGAAEGYLSPWEQRGQAAAGKMADFLGTNGPEAQAMAYQNYQSSPGQQFLIDRMERGATGTAAATGGLQGGNVQAELQRRRLGLAQQDFGNYYNRLSGMAGSGQTAAGALAGNAMQTGGNLANIATGTAGNQANIGTSGAGSISNNLMTMGGNQLQAGRDISTNTMNTANNLANLQAGAGTNAANIYGNAAGGLSNIYGNTGNTLGNLGLNAGNYLSGIEGTYGQGVGSMYGNMGAAKAAGIEGQYGAYNNALSGLNI